MLVVVVVAVVVAPCGFLDLLEHHVGFVRRILCECSVGRREGRMGGGGEFRRNERGGKWRGD